MDEAVSDDLKTMRRALERVAIAIRARSKGLPPEVTGAEKAIASIEDALVVLYRAAGGPVLDPARLRKR
jgi:phosphomevalonate kinase